MGKLGNDKTEQQGEQQIEDANAARQTEQNAPAGTTKTEQSDKAGTSETEQNGKPETFDRAYVENLRTESGNYRKRASDAEQELHVFRVGALGKLADPTDLPYDPAYSDPEKLAAAVDALLEKKPHLKARKLAGDVGQHGDGGDAGAFSLSAMLRENA